MWLFTLSVSSVSWALHTGQQTPPGFGSGPAEGGGGGGGDSGAASGGATAASAASDTLSSALGSACSELPAAVVAFLGPPFPPLLNPPRFTSRPNRLCSDPTPRMVANCDSGTNGAVFMGCGTARLAASVRHRARNRLITCGLAVHSLSCAIIDLSPRRLHLLPVTLPRLPLLPQLCILLPADNGSGGGTHMPSTFTSGTAPHPAQH